MPSTSPSTGPDAPPDEAARVDADNNEFYTEIIEELMAMGLDLARQIAREAETIGACNVINAFERVSRTIRRCALLTLKLSETRRTPRPNAGNRSEARAKIRAEGQQAIDRAPIEPRADPTRHPRGDRLDSLGPGTIPEIIAGLCQSLASAATAIGKPTPRRLRRTAAPRPKARPGNNPNPKAARPNNPPARYRGSG